MGQLVQHGPHRFDTGQGVGFGAAQRREAQHGQPLLQGRRSRRRRAR
ncbi:hypothetical protein ACFQT0_29030 [Hymenobacter humi]|uniref:Uncharacterized protein n=1 Tax=Hymenobacter humi TaxID=1411620 RepID=A0ABW2UEZ3_9BACT